MIEVWRPAGRHEKRPAPSAPPATRAKTACASAGTIRPSRRRDAGNCRSCDDAHRGGSREKSSVPSRERNVPTASSVRTATSASSACERQGQRSERKDGAQRRDRPPRRDKGDRVERAEREQYYAKPFGGSENRNKQADPNSPFAKLAALKQQLEQSTKES